MAEIPYETEHDDIFFEQSADSPASEWSLSEFHRDPREDLSRIPKHWHRALEIIVPANNNAEVWMNGKHLIVTPGQMLIINCGVIHESRRQDYSLPYDGYAVQIARDIFVARIDDFESYTFPDEPVEAPDDLLNTLKTICSLSSSEDPFARIRMDALMIGIVLYVVEHHCTKKNTDTPADIRDIVYLASSRIEASAFGDFSAKKLADSLHVSYAYLSRCFRNETGMTMLEYRDTIRMEQARRLLSSTSMSLEDIAAKLGYKGYPQFARRFREMNNCSPSDWRRNRS